MTLAAAPTPALTNGQNVTVAGASNIELNGNFNITLVNATIFTYTIIESPPTPSTGTYTSFLAGGASKAIASLTRVGPTVTATFASAHGYNNGQTITISGANQVEYNGTYAVATSGPSSTTFTYTMLDGPRAAATGGTVAVGAASLTFTLGQITRDTTHADGTSIVTITPGGNLPAGFNSGATATISGVTPAGWNATATLIGGGGNSTGDNCPSSGGAKKSLCYSITTTPASTATGTLLANSTVSYATTFAHTTSCTGASPTPSVTVTATAANHPFTAGQTVTISGTAGARESAYLGSFVIKAPITANTFTFNNNITTTPPCSVSASGVQVVTAPAAVDKASLINWVRGQDSVGDELSPGGTINIRPSIHGDVVHSRPAVVNYGGSIGVAAFYGSNDGVFHAVNANQTGAAIGSAVPGGEIWGFVAPEFFTKLARLYTNSPPVKLPSTPTGLVPTPTAKDYFFDGATSVYQNGSTVSLFMSARRGGRFIYALNVNDPADPKFLWKKSYTDTNMGELGYTWSTPKAARVRGYAKPVVIFGAGYDPINEDSEPPTANTMGRGIFILDATDGSIVWQARYSSGGGTSCTGTPCSLSGMTYGIPADITLVNRDYDSGGYIDRLYAADVGGNIWRVDLEPAGYAAAASAVGPSTWKVTQFASLGGSATTKRKFFFPPDVVPARNFDLVVAVTGDREHPLYSANSSTSYAIVNRFYALKDTKPGADATGSTTITDGSSGTANATVTGLTDATAINYDLATNDNGFYQTLMNAGEKGVNAPTVPPGGFVYFATSTPSTPSSLTCNNMGTARGYRVNVFTGASTITPFDGGGMPPSPVWGYVTVNVGGSPRDLPYCLGCGDSGGTGASVPDKSSPLGASKPSIGVKPIRKRVYWYLDKHDN
jgi:type IV pilus assembly protein PilY1